MGYLHTLKHSRSHSLSPELCMQQQGLASPLSSHHHTNIFIVSLTVFQQTIDTLVALSFSWSASFSDNRWVIMKPIVPVSSHQVCLPFWRRQESFLRILAWNVERRKVVSESEMAGWLLAGWLHHKIIWGNFPGQAWLGPASSIIFLLSELLQSGCIPWLTSHFTPLCFTKDN